MKYPKKPLAEHRTYKILPDEYPAVMKMRNTLDEKGRPTTIEKIARHFGVGKQTINFILNPELRAQHNKKTVERARIRMEVDPEFREYHTDAVTVYMTERKKVDKVYKKYHQEVVTNANRNRNKKKR